METFPIVICHCVLGIRILPPSWLQTSGFRESSLRTFGNGTIWNTHQAICTHCSANMAWEMRARRAHVLCEL